MQVAERQAHTQMQVDLDEFDDEADDTVEEARR
jgi:hypothetical protein